jgi:hypothetical protein
MTEIITPDSGALADNDPMAIAQAVRATVSRPERERRMSARHRAEMFTWERSAEGMLTTLAVRDDCRGGPAHRTYNEPDRNLEGSSVPSAPL